MWGEIEPCIKPKEDENMKSCGTNSPDLQVRIVIAYMCSAHLHLQKALSVKIVHFDELILKYVFVSFDMLSYK